MNQIEQLKELIFSEEKKQLFRLQERSHSDAILIERTAKILPQAIQKNTANPEFSAVLESTVNECVRKSIKRDRKLFADALFPVIGPAIRRSILETFRAMVSSINQVVENSFSLQGLKWRWQAWRAGLPFADYLLSKTIAYRVEQVFLIQPGTGLLIAHASHHAASDTTDVDAFSAMLTAIRQFVTESFKLSNRIELESVELGDLELTLISSPQAIMAVAVRGVATKGLKHKLYELLETIDIEHRTELEQFSGDQSSMVLVATKLEEALLEKKREQSSDDNSVSKKKQLIFFLCLLGFVAFFAWQAIEKMRHNQRMNDTIRLIETYPGIIIQNVTQTSDQWELSGLRDPLAEDINVIIDKALVSKELFKLDFSPYFSLEEEIITKRVINALKPPEAVSVSLKHNTFYISGEADYWWIEALKQNKTLDLFGYSFKYQSLSESTESINQRIKTQIQIPSQVKFSIRDGITYFSGLAPKVWIDALEKDMTKLNLEFDKRELDYLERVEQMRLLKELQTSNIHFNDSIPVAEDQLLIDIVVKNFQQIYDLSNITGDSLTCVITGHSDGTGTVKANRSIRFERANYMLALLVQAGIPPAACNTAASEYYAQYSAEDLAARKVTFEIKVKPSTASNIGS